MQYQMGGTFIHILSSEICVAECAEPAILSCNAEALLAVFDLVILTILLLAYFVLYHVSYK